MKALKFFLGLMTSVAVMGVATAAQGNLIPWGGNPAQPTPAPPSVEPSPEVTDTPPPEPAESTAEEAQPTSPENHVEPPAETPKCYSSYAVNGKNPEIQCGTDQEPAAEQTPAYKNPYQWGGS